MPARRRQFPFSAALVLLAISLDTTQAQQEPRVIHTLSFPELNQQYVHVRSEFPVSGKTAVLRMANWTPGSYLIRDFSANIERIAFHNGQGRTLSHAKASKSSWKLDVEEGAILVAEYDVHAGELGVNTSWASPDYILLNNASVLLYSDESRHWKQDIHFRIPDGAGRVLTSLPASRTGQGYTARDYDELVDSPVVITDEATHHFSDGKQEYALVNIGAGSLWDGSQAVADIGSIVRACNEFWGEIPFERPFWFFNFLVEQGGGLEHDHSTVIMGSRWQMRDRDDYIKWMSLASHEYFHAWNVRRMRPSSLASYDYEKEQYSSDLWLAEGITSYYDNLLLSRAQLISPDEYFKRLALDLHTLELTPGRHRISLEQASRDAWIRHYKPNANSVNSTISYYVKGAVIGLVLDTYLRRNSRDRSTLDDVMRLMYRRWGASSYPENAFLRAVEEIGGTEAREWLAPMLHTTAEPDVDEALAWYGLLLDRHPVHNAARLEEGPVSAGLGVNWDSESRELVIHSLVHGMSGSEAGLLPGDELLAINGERVTADTMEDRMLRLRPGESAELLISRRGRINSVSLVLDEARSATYEVMLDEDFGSRELRRLESWLGQSLQVNKG